MASPEKPDPKWRRFEKIIHNMHKQLAPQGAVVTPNDKVIGRESNTERQLDVTIRANVAGYGIFIVIECRDESRPIDVNGIGEFATKLQDVMANKGIMISTSGFTSSAVTMAKARGIATRTYIDTENADWRQDVAVSILLIRHSFTYQISFVNVPGYPFPIFEWSEPPQKIKVHSPTGESLGSIEYIVDKMWIDEVIPHEEGTHTAPLVKHAVMTIAGKEAHAELEVTVQVKHHAYLGALPVKMVGLRDEQERFLTTKKITTDVIDSQAIINGTAPGWTELPTAKDLSIRTTMTLTTFDCLPPEGEEG